MNKSRHQYHPSVGKHPDRPSHPAHESARRLGPAEEPSDTKAGGFSRTLCRWLLPTLLTPLIGLLTALLLTLALMQTPDPTALLLPASAVALGLTSLIGGILAGKLHGDMAVRGSLVSGVILLAILSLSALVVGGDGGLSPLLAWLLRLSVLPLHALGGRISRPRKHSPAHTAGRHASKKR